MQRHPQDQPAVDLTRGRAPCCRNSKSGAPRRPIPLRQGSPLARRKGSIPRRQSEKRPHRITQAAGNRLLRFTNAQSFRQRAPKRLLLPCRFFQNRLLAKIIRVEVASCLLPKFLEPLFQAPPSHAHFLLITSCPGQKGRHSRLRAVGGVHRNSFSCPL